MEVFAGSWSVCRYICRMLRQNTWRFHIHILTRTWQTFFNVGIHSASFDETFIHENHNMSFMQIKFPAFSIQITIAGSWILKSKHICRKFKIWMYFSRSPQNVFMFVQKFCCNTIITINMFFFENAERILNNRINF